MATWMLLGVLPVLGVTASQVRPAGLVDASAEKANDVPVLVTEMLWVMGAAPASAVTLMAPWLTLSNGLLLTFNVTGITSGVAIDPGTVSVTFPLQTCGVRPPVCTETITWFWL